MVNLSRQTSFPSRRLGARLRKAGGAFLAVLCWLVFAVPQAEAMCRKADTFDASLLNEEMRIGLFVGNGPIGSWDPLGLWTFGFGGQASGGFGVGGTIALGFHFGHDPSKGWLSGWDADVLITKGFGLYAGLGGSAGGYAVATSATNVSDTVGKGWEIGGSGGEALTVGGALVGGMEGCKPYGGMELSLGAGGGFPVEVHAFETDTISLFH